MKHVRGILTAIFVLICAGLFIALFVSVAHSGYSYQFDIDELFYSQFTYLYAHGYRPYLDVYATVYTPLFFWLTTPVFLLRGFSFAGLYVARVVMIALLVIRLAAAYFTLRMIFNKRTAFLFLPMFLFDPFAVLTTMQYRPDNLMLTFMTVGLMFFALGLRRKKSIHFALSGFFLGCAVVVLSKALPTIGILAVVFGIYCLTKKRIRDFLLFAGYGLMVPLLFVLYLLSQGMFHEMIQQTFIDILLLYTNFQYPIPIYSLLRPDNIFIFGTMGKPITWVYAWLIAPLGLAGLYHVLHDVIAKKGDESKNLMKVILGLSLIAQWAVLFAVQVAFMQHYMEVNWLHAAFGAFAIDELLTVSAKHNIAKYLVPCCIFAVFVLLTKYSIDYNSARATITGLDIQAAYQTRWKQIPENEAVFPAFLFRPSIYPPPYGGFIVNLPEPILRRLPDIPTLLESKKPRILMDDYTLTRLPTDIQQYINAHYTRVPGDNELMTRNE